MPSVLCLLPLAAAPLGGDELAPPFLVEAGGRALDVPGGTSAPFLHDLDGDGRLDLLVGQFAEGRLRVYPNVGEPGAPRFDAFRFVETEEGPLSVPHG